MPATIVTGSANISKLDSRVKSDLCTGEFNIDASVSQFIGAGASAVLGAKIRITNPFGVVIKDYTGSYDIPAPLTAIYQFDVPTQAGKYQYGIYTFALQVTDSDSKTYEVIKSQNICAYPDDSKSCKDIVQLNADCSAGKLCVLIAEPPTYQGKFASSKTQSWDVYYPTKSGINSFTSSVGNFSVQLFEGVYKVEGTLCAVYSFDDNLSIAIGSTGSWEKNVKCVIDYTCVYPRLSQLHKTLYSSCTEKERIAASDTFIEVLGLLTMINITLGSGNDASEQIEKLEGILGCSCTCDCATASPIINNTPSGDITIEGCNVTKTTVGLTDHYTIDNVQYVVVQDPSQSIVTVSGPTGTCTKTFTVSIDITQLLLAINAGSVDNPLQESFTATLINNFIENVDASSIGLDDAAWQALDLAGKFQAIINFISQGGAACTGTVTTTQSKAGTDIIFNFAIANAYSMELYVDNVLRGTVLAGATSYTVSGLADGLLHNYVLIPRCENDHKGTNSIGSFQYIACPQIEPLSVSSNNVSGADCPYDLSTLISGGLPAGITASWHTAQNTSPSSLVGNPAAVNSGVYYLYAKDANNCYSSVSTQVQIVCDSTSNCTAPQNLTAGFVSGGVLVAFQGAAFPPPANSYTVKRRIYSDPDISGSYTTIGTPSYNSGSGRWEILDAGLSIGVNGVYVYRAISNCTSTSPSLDYVFAALYCPSPITRTPGANQIAYSFTKGFGATQYIVHLYDSTGTVELQQQTKIPGGGSTITGTFTGLNPSTNYQIALETFVSTYSKLCPKVPQATSTGDNFRIRNEKGGITITETSVGAGSYFTNTGGAFPIANGSEVTGVFASFTGAIQVTTSGTSGAASATLYLNGVAQQCLDVTAAGAHTFTAATYLPSQIMLILISPGTC